MRYNRMRVGLITNSKLGLGSKGVRHSTVFRSVQRTASHKRCSAPSPGAIAMAHSEWMCWQGLNVTDDSDSYCDMDSWRESHHKVFSAQAFALWMYLQANTKDKQ